MNFPLKRRTIRNSKANGVSFSQLCRNFHHHQSREPLELTEGNSSGVRVFYMHTALSLVFYTHLTWAHVHKRKLRLRGETSPTQMTRSHRARLDPQVHIFNTCCPAGGGARGGRGGVTHLTVWGAGPSTWGQAGWVGQSHSTEPEPEAVQERKT